jgi:hypothetical protein
MSETEMCVCGHTSAEHSNFYGVCQYEGDGPKDCKCAGFELEE